MQWRISHQSSWCFNWSTSPVEQFVVLELEELVIRVIIQYLKLRIVIANIVVKGHGHRVVLSLTIT